MSVLDQDFKDIFGDVAVVEEKISPLEVVTEETPVPPGHAQWSRFRSLFSEAMTDTLYKIDDLERLIGQGKAIFFPGKNAALVGEKAQYAQETVFQVLWAVGDMDEVMAMAPGVEAMARLIGCTSMLIEGRRGWEKMLKPHGYEFFSVTLKKAL